MKRIVLSLSLTAIILSGCNEKPALDSEREVVVHFSEHLLSSFLKSTASEDEKVIDRLILYSVNDLDAVENVYDELAPTLSGGIALTLPRRVKTLYAVANPSDELAAATPANLSQLTALTEGFATAPQSPFLMSGKGNIIGNTVTIELVRAVAKFRIIGEGGFQIQSVTVENASPKGYVFAQHPFSVPADAKIDDYLEINSTDPVFYIAESALDSQPKFVVSGLLASTTVDYTIVQLTKGGNAIDILRNTYYEITITPSDGNFTITVNIPDWEDAEIDEIIF